jgi:hypothetical protein
MFAVSALVLVIGCGQGDVYQLGPSCMVEGMVFVDKMPCRIPKDGFGRVWLYPDASKGNTCPQVPCGDIDADGRFHIRTRDREGAPAGWYKVQVVAQAPADKQKSAKRQDLIAPKYADAARSGLVLQVVEKPTGGAYDLKVRK